MKRFIKSKILNNKKGQMAIFVAIIFQVLFVLFAMSINVALVVHDKVNLQNSVDLAAYYGAQKQAELLNVIAHQNYQVRQAWKLLAWRYRVLGQYGVGSNFRDMPSYHPARRRAQDRDSNETIFKPNVAASLEVNKETPIVCVGYNPIWSPTTGSDQFCQKRSFRVPDVYVSNNVVAAVSYGLQQSFNQNYEKLLNTLARSCSNMIAFNYGYTTSILSSFRYEQKYRKELMYGLINQMRSSVNDFIDLNGDSVRAGVDKMVKKNLTFSNLEAGPEVVYYNSLGDQGASFFKNIDINPRLLYTDSENARCSLTDTASKFASQYPTDSAKIRFQKMYDNWEGLYNNAQESITPNNVYQYSLGIEKNPWNWIYSAVVAQTTTRPIFFPIGDRLVIKARAFAKPFGGRIGPWHKEVWGRGDQISKGGARVDLLVPPRLDENGAEPSLTELRKDPTIFPNHSRYPGDKFGLRSHLALNSIKNLGRARLSTFTHYETLGAMGTENHDSLAPKEKNPILREYEIAAIAPDLFDATYYSIEPEFSQVYMQKLIDHKSKVLKAGRFVEDVAKVRILGDLGSEPGEPSKAMDAFEQINISLKHKNPATFYYIKEPKHLLTGWLHGFKALDFSSGNAKPWFANCDKDSTSSSYGEDGVPKIPGGCLKNGGRTGYSVKLFSGKMFKNGNLKLGGEGGGSGQIRNSPPTSIWN